MKTTKTTMKTTKTTTAVAVINTNMQTFIKGLEARLKAIKTVSDSSYIGSKNIDGICNVETETNLEKLISAGAHVTGCSNAYNDYAKKIGLTTWPEFKVNGNTVADWDHNIKLRIAIVNSAEEKSSIESDLKEAKGFLDKEEQRALFIAEKAAKYAQ